ncbi:RNA polymerase sigma factor [Roseiconus lacunae]|uniref:RNA polymerase sigma factor n=1 Tax=Roseiconus lacunae TaxID=2605694 RepID=A0ABT7PRA6_9BACT|nr:RNA polymerase sigma factor [Roseiconus lacunae]MDM4019022.1 RNA polymerase sigma factor [Roseiconus lacunae]
MSDASRHDRQTQFDVICEENRMRLGRIARFYGKADADDLLQEILLQLWRSLPNFREQCEASTWCFRIALNTAISWSRNRRHRIHTTNVEPSATAAINTTSADQQRRQLDRFLESLSELDRATLIMYLENFNNTEIARTMGVGEGAIRTRLCRIRNRLKQWGQD